MHHTIFRKATIVCSLAFFILFLPALCAEVKTDSNHTQFYPLEENFLIRRIAEFWKDGDLNIVKSQILDFLEMYPESYKKDECLGILGEIYFKEECYEEAIAAYEKITDPAITEKIGTNKLQSYYQLDYFTKILEEGSALSRNVHFADEKKEQFHFLMAEAFFKKALSEKNKETKQEYAREAKNHYNSLAHPRYASTYELALPEIYCILEDYRLAAQTFQELAGKYPDMEEELLFRAASIQALYSKEEASKSFKEITNKKGEKALEATYNLMILLFQTEQYEKVIATYEERKPDLTKNPPLSMHFVIGKSFFSIGDYQNAIRSLSQFIECEKEPSDSLKNALLVQMTSAQNIKNEKLFNQTFEKLKTLFPNDPEIPKALFMHAMILKEQGNLDHAESKLIEIKNTYKGFENHESLMFEYGLIAYEKGKWNESYLTFKNYLNDFEKNSHRDLAYKLFLSSAINLYTESLKSEEWTYSRTNFFKDLDLFLSNSHLFNTNEIIEYSLVYSKIAFEVEAYSAAIRCLQDHIFSQTTQDTTALAHAHYIAGLCFLEMKEDPSGVCMHLEEAIHYSPELYDIETTYIQLYNSYLALAELEMLGKIETSLPNQESYHDQAANALFCALKKGSADITLENKIWLANHYYKKSNTLLECHGKQEALTNKEYARATSRANKIYNELIFQNEEPITLTEETLFLENEWIQFAKLMQAQGEHSKKLVLIKSLLQQQNLSPTLAWSSQKEAFFELGITYECLGEYEKAFETFNFIKTSFHQFPSEIVSRSMLGAARIQFEMLDHSLKSDSNQIVISILNDLKELQIRKNVSSEPIHLSAALEYAQIRSKTSEKEQDIRYVFFLNRMLEDFNNTKDVNTKDYIFSLNKDQNKRELFDSYMMFIEAEKARIEAKKSLAAEDFKTMEEHHQKALQLYAAIKHSPLTPVDLFEKVNRSMEQIQSLNTY